MRLESPCPGWAGGHGRVVALTQEAAGEALGEAGVRPVPGARGLRADDTNPPGSRPGCRGGPHGHPPTPPPAPAGAAPVRAWWGRGLGVPRPQADTPHRPLPAPRAPPPPPPAPASCSDPGHPGLAGVSNRPGVGPPAPAPTAEGSALRPALLGRDWGPAGTGCPHGTGAGPGRPQQRLRDTVWPLCRYRPCPPGCLVCPCTGAPGSPRASRAPTDPPATPERQQGRVKLQLYCFYPRPSPAGIVEAKSRARLCPAPAPLAPVPGQGREPPHLSALSCTISTNSFLGCGVQRGFYGLSSGAGPCVGIKLPLLRAASPLLARDDQLDARSSPSSTLHD